MNVTGGWTVAKTLLGSPGGGTCRACHLKRMLVNLQEHLR